MSNLAQFFNQASTPYGGQINLPYGGDVLTFADGSQWLAPTTTAPFAYTSDYAHLPAFMTSPHPLLPGPESGLFVAPSTTFNIAFKPATGVYCTAPVVSWGNASGGSYYYTSSDGVNWTRRTFPNPLINYMTVVCVGGVFIALASVTTTDGIIYSSDAVTWTSVATTPSVANPQDVIGNGSVLVALGSSTSAGYSTDGGASWTNASLASAPPSFSIPGQGVGTWNAGAGLFVVPTSASGAYQTSPDGITWTLRNAQASYVIYSSRLTNATKFASNATTTIAVGLGGFFATTTDGLTWSNHGYIPAIPSNNTAPAQVYFDGTRFVVRIAHRVFYSTNATTWTEGANLGGGTNVVPQSGGVLFLMSGMLANIPTKCLRVADVTLTAPQTVISQDAAANQVTNANYRRIK